MSERKYDIVMTKRLLEKAWKRGYERVEIDIQGQHIFAWPHHDKWNQEKHEKFCKPFARLPWWNGQCHEFPPIWDIIKDISGGMSCGNGGMKRGNQGQVCPVSDDPYFQPGIYVRDVEPFFWTEEKRRQYEEQCMLHRMHRKMTGVDLGGCEGIMCPHGPKELCEAGCWEHWNKFI